ncbi:GTP diphosphokinase [Halomonadaceae bacterium KBTZ08]
MVKVRTNYASTADGGVDIGAWVDHIDAQHPLEDRETLIRACRRSLAIDRKAVREDRLWAPGASSFLTGLEMAQILTELRLDQETLVAAVLYRAVREERMTLEAVHNEFGETIAQLIDGVLQMAVISTLHTPLKGNVLGQAQGQQDNVRRMLVTMVDDVRVALIKLAERTCAIRAVKDAPPEKRLRVAREVFDIYAPLAHRLGIGHIKWELEDLSFRYLHESAYKKVAKLLDEKRVDRDAYVQRVAEILKGALGDAGIEAEVAGRAKHIYSIWRKMRRKGIDFSEVYDTRALRVLVPEVRDCYAAIGVVHGLWRHIPHEFDDYIANPKQNGYQSLHTAVVGPEGKTMEVQIRTHAMHEDAELGVCAHWRYKGTEKGGSEAAYEAKINWLRQVIEWQEDLGDNESLVEQLRRDVSSERIYVLTPEGHVVDMPSGATPLDFAYKVHTEVGHACRGAKVNGRIVPLTHTLRTGDQVTVLRGSEAAPSRNWLNPGLGYIQTSRARAKVTRWFKMQDREQNIADGKAVLEDELGRLSLRDLDPDVLAQKVNYSSATDMYAAIGAGDLKPAQVVKAAQRILEPSDRQLDLRLTRRRSEKDRKDPDIHIEGVGNLKTVIAQCCTPVPGDAIVGYISVGRGVTVHRDDCTNLVQLRQKEASRIIDVDWGAEPEARYPVTVEVEAYDRAGLLNDITSVLANRKLNVLSMQTETYSESLTASTTLTVEISDIDQLSRLLASIRQLPNVIDVYRHREA